jgi:hypothetical protein
MDNPRTTNKISYLKADDNKIINEKCIRWVKKMSNCLEVCTRSSGCNIDAGQTHKICKSNNPDSYEKLNRLFE